MVVEVRVLLQEPFDRDDPIAQRIPHPFLERHAGELEMAFCLYRRRDSLGIAVPLRWEPAPRNKQKRAHSRPADDLLDFLIMRQLCDERCLLRRRELREEPHDHAWLAIPQRPPGDVLIAEEPVANHPLDILDVVRYEDRYRPVLPVSIWNRKPRYFGARLEK